MNACKGSVWLLTDQSAQALFLSPFGKCDRKPIRRVNVYLDVSWSIAMVFPRCVRLQSQKREQETYAVKFLYFQCQVAIAHAVQ